MSPRLRRTIARLLSVLVFGLLARSAMAGGPTKVECNERYEEGISLRSQGKLQAARASLVTCASTSCPAELREECVRRAEEVNTLLPSVIFEVKDVAGSDLSDVTIAMDGAPLTSKLDGSAITIDPGEHSFQFVVVGQAPVSRALLIREGDKARREHVVIGSSPAPSPAPPVVARPVPAAAPVPPAGPHRRRVVAYVVGGAGLVGLVVGAAFGTAAFSQWSSAKSECGGACPANSPGRSERSSALTSATVSTVAFIAGGVGVAAGGVLLFMSPSGQSSQAAGARIAPVLGGSTTGIVAEGFW